MHCWRLVECRNVALGLWALSGVEGRSVIRGARGGASGFSLLRWTVMALVA